MTTSVPRIFVCIIAVSGFCVEFSLENPQHFAFEQEEQGPADDWPGQGHAAPADWPGEGILGLPLFVFKEIRMVEDRVGDLIEGIDADDDELHLETASDNEGDEYESDDDGDLESPVMSLTVFEAEAIEAEDESEPDIEAGLDPLGANTGLDVVELQELMMALDPALATARCLATCSLQTQPDSHTADMCRRTCGKLYENRVWHQICGSDTCRYGCTVACSTLETASTLANRFTIEIALQKCSLFWTAMARQQIPNLNSIEQEDGKQEFLVAAQDENSMFYYIGTTRNLSIPVPNHILSKSTKLIIISVGASGPSGLNTIDITDIDRPAAPGDQCIQTRPSEVGQSGLSDSQMQAIARPPAATLAPVVLVTALSVALTTLLFILVLVSVRYAKKQETNNINREQTSSPNCAKNKAKRIEKDEGYIEEIYVGFHPYKVYVSPSIEL